MAKLLSLSRFASVRNNVVIAFGDLWMSHTALVDRFLPLISRCTWENCSPSLPSSLSSSTPLLRLQALVVLVGLIQRDFLKWRPALFFHFSLALADSDKTVRNFAQGFYLSRMKEKSPLLSFCLFIELLFFLNGFDPAANVKEGRRGRKKERREERRGREENGENPKYDEDSGKEEEGARAQERVGREGGPVEEKEDEKNRKPEEKGKEKEKKRSSDDDSVQKWPLLPWKNVIYRKDNSFSPFSDASGDSQRSRIIILRTLIAGMSLENRLLIPVKVCSQVFAPLLEAASYLEEERENERAGAVEKNERKEESEVHQETFAQVSFDHGGSRSASKCEKWRTRGKTSEEREGKGGRLAMAEGERGDVRAWLKYSPVLQLLRDCLLLISLREVRVCSVVQQARECERNNEAEEREEGEIEEKDVTGERQGGREKGSLNSQWRGVRLQTNNFGDGDGTKSSNRKGGRREKGSNTVDCGAGEGKFEVWRGRRTRALPPSSYASSSSSSLSPSNATIVSQLMKKTLVENSIPVLIELKRLFESCHAPLQGCLIKCLRNLFSDFPTEVDELLAADERTAKELKYEMQKYEENEARARVMDERTKREEKVAHSEVVFLVGKTRHKQQQTRKGGESIAHEGGKEDGREGDDEGWSCGKGASGPVSVRMQFDERKAKNETRAPPFSVPTSSSPRPHTHPLHSLAASAVYAVPTPTPSLSTFTPKTRSDDLSKGRNKRLMAHSPMLFTPSPMVRRAAAERLAAEEAANRVLADVTLNDSDNGMIYMTPLKQMSVPRLRSASRRKLIDG